MRERPGAPSANRARYEATPSASAKAKSSIAPVAIQGLEVLAMSVTRLDAYVGTMVESNPLLELKYDESSLCFEELVGDEDDAQDDDTPVVPRERASNRSLASGSEFDWSRVRDDYSEYETLQSYLRMQLSGLCAPEDDKNVLNAIIELVDDNGYFAGSLRAICSEHDLSNTEGERLLGLVQSLSPLGVGARSLSECLSLQISDSTPHARVIKRILRDSIDDFAENRTTKIKRQYGLSSEDLSEIRAIVSSLNPRPGSAFFKKSETVYVIPDLVIERNGLSFSVRVNGELSETVVLNTAYDAMVEKMDSTAKEWYERKLSEAESVISNIDQRRKTLHRFGMYLVERQNRFFKYGEVEIAPMTMQQVADALGVHVSTVSRTVQGKYALTPWGVFPLKHFFSNSISCSSESSGKSVSSVMVKSRIREIINQEDSARPLSDSAIAEVLNREGFEISRRTVAKYRESLGIFKQSQRRR